MTARAGRTACIAVSIDAQAPSNWTPVSGIGVFSRRQRRARDNRTGIKKSCVAA